MGNSMETGELSAAGLLGRRILVADDEAPTRWSYVGLLRSAGARVTEARDGVEALELARDHRPDLILADISMPRLDGLALCAALRRDPSLDGVPVVLLSDGEPPQAVWGANGASRPLVDAVVAALSGQEPPPPPVAPDREERQREAESTDTPEERRPDHVASLVERENVRAQSAVAMHREPANRAPRASAPVWRLLPGSGPRDDAHVSGFEVDLQGMSRVLGAAFLALLAGTVAVLVWSEAVSVGTMEAFEAPQFDSEPGPPEEPPPDLAPERDRGIRAFSGVLRSGADPAIVTSDTQGILRIDGPQEVRVQVDGVERGVLPVVLPLEEGRHLVRYRVGSSFTDRFYYVKSGATRSLRVITLPGGFVDAR